MSIIFGETLTFGQENGPDVQLVVFGDEFYARFEDTNPHSAGCTHKPEYLWSRVKAP
jgi:hypothetical protein